jgi:DNA-binding GntR family transcriptional regulator
MNAVFLARGELNGNSTLTADEVVLMRQLYARRALKDCKVTMTGLAKRFGVSVMQVRRILHREQWVHVA